jgi:CHAD domain-containing protein
MARVGLVKAIGVRRLEQGLCRLARSLAPIRDADVLEEHLGKLWPAGVEQPDDPIWKATLTVLTRRLEARRQAALDALNRPGAVRFPLFERLRELIEKIESRPDALEDASSLVEGWATDFARRARLAIRIDRPDRWHRVRWLGTRLRYAI